jgi:D-cysteine desulfhydrase
MGVESRPAGLMRRPRVELAALPTPLRPLPRLSEALGVELWVKRDDLTGLGLGGNKARKLEFLAGAALAERADVLVTGGGPGSNHAQMTAAAAARLRLRCDIVLYGSPLVREPANLRLSRLLGAEVHFTGDPDRGSVDAEIPRRCRLWEQDGHVPYAIPRGGASPVGCSGYVEAAFELDEQLRTAGVAPTRLYLATGSCGTQAGLALGALLCGASYRVVGVTVSRDRDECVDRIRALIGEAAALLGVDPPESPVDVVDGYIGPGYGKPSLEGQEASRLAAGTEGLLLDHTFTAKAMAALVADARSGRLDGPVVFLHTGGTGGLLGGEP